MVRPLLALAARPLVYAASVAYWLVVGGLIEVRLAPSRVRADRQR